MHHTAWRSLLIASVVLTCVWLALQEGPRAASWQLADEVTPVPELVHGCRLRGDEARAHADALEQSARARWQRAPFAPREAPRALVEIGEAEACYEAARDRAGRLRSAAARHLYEAELERRFAHARLLLRALTRQPVDRAHALRQGERVRDQVATLLALLERAPATAEPLARELQQLDRSYAGQVPARPRSNEVHR